MSDLLRRWWLAPVLFVVVAGSMAVNVHGSQPDRWFPVRSGHACGGRALRHRPVPLGRRRQRRTGGRLLPRRRGQRTDLPHDRGRDLPRRPAPADPAVGAARHRRRSSRLGRPHRPRIPGRRPRPAAVAVLRRRSTLRRRRGDRDLRPGPERGARRSHPPRCQRGEAPDGPGPARRRRSRPGGDCDAGRRRAARARPRPCRRSSVAGGDPRHEHRGARVTPCRALAADGGGRATGTTADTRRPRSPRRSGDGRRPARHPER